MMMMLTARWVKMTQRIEMSPRRGPFLLLMMSRSCERLLWRRSSPYQSWLATAPPTADWAKATPASSPQVCNPRIAVRQSDHSHHAAQVTSHIELPPYQRPQSSLDLVPSEIVFGRMLEAKTDAAPVGDDNHPPKRTHKVPTAKKIVVAKYVIYSPQSNSDTAV
jgi:hypothetical protein